MRSQEETLLWQILAMDSVLFWIPFRNAKDDSDYNSAFDSLLVDALLADAIYCPEVSH